MKETDFDRFWEVYPPRKGDRAKGPARILFEKYIKSGIPADTIINSASRFAAMESTKVGTEFIMQAQRWLRNKRWQDFTYEPGKPETITVLPAKVFIREGTPQWKAWQKYKSTPCVNFGWWFPTEWPPEEKL